MIGYKMQEIKKVLNRVPWIQNEGLLVLSQQQ